MATFSVGIDLNILVNNLSAIDALGTRLQSIAETLRGINEMGLHDLSESIRGIGGQVSDLNDQLDRVARSRTARVHVQTSGTGSAEAAAARASRGRGSDASFFPQMAAPGQSAPGSQEQHELVPSGSRSMVQSPSLRGTAEPLTLNLPDRGIGPDRNFLGEFLAADLALHGLIHTIRELASTASEVHTEEARWRILGYTDAEVRQTSSDALRQSNMVPGLTWAKALEDRRHLELIAPGKITDRTFQYAEMANVISPHETDSVRLTNILKSVEAGGKVVDAKGEMNPQGIEDAMRRQVAMMMTTNLPSNEIWHFTKRTQDTLRAEGYDTDLDRDALEAAVLKRTGAGSVERFNRVIGDSGTTLLQKNPELGMLINSDPQFRGQFHPQIIGMAADYTSHPGTVTQRPIYGANSIDKSWEGLGGNTKLVQLITNAANRAYGGHATEPQIQQLAAQYHIDTNEWQFRRMLASQSFKATTETSKGQLGRVERDPQALWDQILKDNPARAWADLTSKFENLVAATISVTHAMTFMVTTANALGRAAVFMNRHPGLGQTITTGGEILGGMVGVGLLGKMLGGLGRILGVVGPAAAPAAAGEGAAVAGGAAAKWLGLGGLKLFSGEVGALGAIAMRAAGPLRLLAIVLGAIAAFRYGGSIVNGMFGGASPQQKQGGSEPQKQTSEEEPSDPLGAVLTGFTIWQSARAISVLGSAIGKLTTAGTVASGVLSLAGSFPLVLTALGGAYLSFKGGQQGGKEIANAAEHGLRPSSLPGSMDDFGRPSRYQDGNGNQVLPQDVKSWSAPPPDLPGPRVGKKPELQGNPLWNGTWGTTLESFGKNYGVEAMWNRAKQQLGLMPPDVREPEPERPPIATPRMSIFGGQVTGFENQAPRALDGSDRILPQLKYNQDPVDWSSVTGAAAPNVGPNSDAKGAGTPPSAVVHDNLGPMRERTRQLAASLNAGTEHQRAEIAARIRNTPPFGQQAAPADTSSPPGPWTRLLGPGTPRTDAQNPLAPAAPAAMPGLLTEARDMLAPASPSGTPGSVAQLEAGQTDARNPLAPAAPPPTPPHHDATPDLRVGNIYAESIILGRGQATDAITRQATTGAPGGQGGAGGAGGAGGPGGQAAPSHRPMAAPTPAQLHAEAARNLGASLGVLPPIGGGSPGDASSDSSTLLGNTSRPTTPIFPQAGPRANTDPTGPLPFASPALNLGASLGVVPTPGAPASNAIFPGAAAPNTATDAGQPDNASLPGPRVGKAAEAFLDAPAGQGGGDGAVGPLGNTFAQKAPAVMQMLQRDFGINRTSAAAIVGNLGHESGLRAINEIGKPEGRGGFGWAQWTGARRTEFFQWAAQHHLDPKSDAANYGFLKHELQTTHKSTIDDLRSHPNQGAMQATAMVEKDLEGARIVNMASRNRYTAMALGASTEQQQMQMQQAAAAVKPPQPNDSNYRGMEGGAMHHHTINVNTHLDGQQIASNQARYMFDASPAALSGLTGADMRSTPIAPGSSLI